MRNFIAFILLALLSSVSFWACSPGNREGPDVTCADLECGRINACADGIIAQCADGVTVRFHACNLEDTCSEAWQVDGAYRCESAQTDCEGCRPERSGCEAGDGTGGAGGAEGGLGGMLPG